MDYLQSSKALASWWICVTHCAWLDKLYFPGTLDLWPFLVASVIHAVVCVCFAVSASTFKADRELWQSCFVWIHERERSRQRRWGNPEPELTAESWDLCQNPSFQMWGCEAAAAVTSGAFCTSWPAGYFVYVWRPYICVIVPVCAWCWRRGFRLLMCLPKHTTESGDKNVFGAYGQACTRSVYMCVCVYTVSCRSRSSPSECKTVFLQLHLLLFRTWITHQVLYCFLLYFPLLSSCPIPPLVSRSCLPRLLFPQEFLEFMPTTREMTILLG